jgi:hypothetical protein
VLAGKVSDGETLKTGSNNIEQGFWRGNAAGPGNDQGRAATAGETVALGKLDQAATGDALVPEKAQAPAGISGLAARHHYMP